MTTWIRRTAQAVGLVAHLLLAGSVAASTLVRLADTTGSAAGRRAALLCLDAVVAPAGDPMALALLDEALALAETALASNTHDAKAHFAVFCSLGRRIEIEGFGVDSLDNVARLRKSLEAALASEPELVDALVAQGILLTRLPWLLGGDDEAGEVRLRRALELDPASDVARIALAGLTEE